MPNFTKNTNIGVSRQRQLRSMAWKGLCGLCAAHQGKDELINQLYRHTKSDWSMVMNNFKSPTTAACVEDLDPSRDDAQTARGMGAL